MEQLRVSLLVKVLLYPSEGGEFKSQVHWATTCGPQSKVINLTINNNHQLLYKM